TILSRQVGCSEMQTALVTAALQCRPGRRLFAGQMLIRIEDLNLPKLGALELLRGFVDQRGLRNSKDDTWLRGEGIHLVASSAAPGLTGQGAEPGPPGSQSGLLMPRLARHFVELFVPEPAEEDVKKIFMEVSRQILQVNGAGDGLVAAFSAHQEGSSSARRYKVEDALALATLHLSKLMKDVLRQHAPARLGITSLRDVARLLQGVARAAPHHFTEKIQLAKLWAHEALRTFEDRITTDAGQRRFREVLSQQLETYFGMEPALEGLSFRLDTSSGQYVDSDSQ
ncbi:DNAH6, partial [Symbiodinium necroappetens]